MGDVIDINSKRVKQYHKPIPISANDFAERMIRIKNSLERINALMAELKEKGESEE